MEVEDNADYPLFPDDDVVMDDPQDEGPTAKPEIPCKEYYPGAAKTYGRGETFMDGFRADEYAEERKSNVFYPFASSAEWELASWLVRRNLSMDATDEFLKLELVSNLTSD